MQNVAMTEETKNFLAIPTYVRHWRKLRKLTQDELGAIVGASGSSISQLETGKQGFTDKTLADLARALEVSPYALLLHDPRRSDAFWPLFEAAERLEGDRRRQALRIIQAALDLENAA
jgi:transcriptional regulator with XRE-family HTH domain